MKETMTIKGKTCRIFGEPDAKTILLQAVDAHDLEGMDKETAYIDEMTGDIPYLLAAFQVEDWNHDLAPWAAPPVFGKAAFGNGAPETLAFVTGELIPALSAHFGGMHDQKPQYLIGGYSLAGLFALWAAYQTDLFSGVAAVSPSVWFPGWKDYMLANQIRTGAVYLSLGDKEEKAKNHVMAQVGDAIRAGYEKLRKTEGVTGILEWNPGNHFTDSELRTAKGFAWLLGRVQR